MRAAWYERQGDPDAVLVVGEMPDPQPGPGEVRIRVSASGVNPGDVKKREGWLGSSMPYPRVIPHSDGAGEIDAVGEGVSEGRTGERVWCYGAQTYRPFGTAAEFVVVPEHQAVELPTGVEFEQGACLGIPGLTAHRALFADGSILDATVLVAGAAGAVGATAVQLARWGGARVLATVREEADLERARRAGAAEVFVLGGGVAEFLQMLKGRIGAIHLIDSDGTLHGDETSTHRPFGEGFIDFTALAPKLLDVPNIQWWCIDMCFWAGSWELVEPSLKFVRNLLSTRAVVG